MKNFNRFLFLFSVLLNATFLFSQQTWVEMMADPTVNFYDVRQSFTNIGQERIAPKKVRDGNPLNGGNGLPSSVFIPAETEAL